MEHKTLKILKTADVILIASFLIFAFAFYFIFNLNGNNNSDETAGITVVIKVNGEIYRELPIDTDADVEIYLSGQIHSHSNTVRIKDKQVYMLYADCPGGICLRHKPLTSDNITDIGDIIVCLPNRVTVEIKSKSQHQKEFDAVIINKS